MARPMPRLPPVMNSVLPASPSAIVRPPEGFVRGERRDSNPRPPGPQPGALPTELRPPRRLRLPCYGAFRPTLESRVDENSVEQGRRSATGSSTGEAEPGAAAAAPGPRSESELAGDAAGAAPTAAEHADQLTGVEAEALEDARVLVRVDLIGQLAVGLRDLVVLAARPQQLEDLLVGYVRAGWVRGGARAEGGRRRFGDLRVFPTRR